MKSPRLARPKIAAAFDYKPPAHVRWGTFTHDGIPMAAVINEKSEVCRLHFRRGGKGQAFLAAWKIAWPTTEFVHDQKAVAPLAEKLAKGGLVRIRVTGTRFQREVWQSLLGVPAGKVVSYGELAKLSNRPKAMRAVGNACGSNPIAFLVPCHRVIAGDGSIGGFGSALPIKLKLLKREGFTNFTKAKKKRA